MPLYKNSNVHISLWIILENNYGIIIANKKTATFIKNFYNFIDFMDSKTFYI